MLAAAKFQACVDRGDEMVVRQRVVTEPRREPARDVGPAPEPVAAARVGDGSREATRGRVWPSPNTARATSASPTATSKAAPTRSYPRSRRRPRHRPGVDEGAGDILPRQRAAGECDGAARPGGDDRCGPARRTRRRRDGPPWRTVPWWFHPPRLQLVLPRPPEHRPREYTVEASRRMTLVVRGIRPRGAAD